MSSFATSSPVSASTFAYLIRWPVCRLSWLNEIFSLSEVAGYNATGQVTSERRKKPFQFARGAMGYATPVWDPITQDEQRSPVPTDALASNRFIWLLRSTCGTNEEPNVQPLFDHDQPSGHDRAVPRGQSIRRQSCADARRLSRLPGTRDPQHPGRYRTRHDALGNAATFENGRYAGDEHPQHVVAALGSLAEA